MPPRSSLVTWLPWVIGLALLGALVAVSLHFSEARAFVALAERAQPVWIGVAVLLQAATYVAQGRVFRCATRGTESVLPAADAWRISLAKQFVDQALPSAGLSGSVLVAGALGARRVPPPVAMAAVALNVLSFNGAYVIALALALAIATVAGHASVLVVTMFVVFTLFAFGLAAIVFRLAGRERPAVVRLVMRVAPMRHAIDALRSADPALVRSRARLFETTLYQLAIILLDAATLFVLVLSLGVLASPAGIFVSFMVSSLFRTVGIAPGGLGTFEASAVVALKMVGLDLPVALSATLMFRGLSFWLPMLPGSFYAGHLADGSVHAGYAADRLEAYWARDAASVADALGTGLSGLSAEEAARRLTIFGPGDLRASQRLTRLHVLANQLRSPLLLLLVFAAVASAVTSEWTDAGIVLVIVVATVALGYSREYRAESAAGALRARLQTKATVVRDGRSTAVPRGEIVPGDVVLLAAGSLVPGDAVVVEATDFYVSESALTGESYPVEKRPGRAEPQAALNARSNCVFLGSNVRSGTARCLVVRTGDATEIGAIATGLEQERPETDFDRGIRQFGYLVTSAMVLIVAVVFVVHVANGRPAIETLLFAVALAVGLSPELLPAILSLNLARGAAMMARRGVLVRHLHAIENLGSMDVLCTDKTGTLTEGVVRLHGAWDPSGRPSPAPRERAAWNAALESGLSNPLDDAILEAGTPDLTAVRKLGEIPFDFVRRCVSVFVESPDGRELITKGACPAVLDVCVRTADGRAIDAAARSAIDALVDEWSRQGIRALAVASRRLDGAACTREDERDLTLLGFVTFLDRPKAGVDRALADLGRLGVTVKLISGDSCLVARHLASLVGLPADRVLSGADLRRVTDVALPHLAERTAVFAEVDPNEKERIIRALRRARHVVGFLGDGVNDAPAMHAADTSLSVEGAVDVARDAADFVLLERDLDVIRGGIEEGRRTFANTLKYILTTASANLGNMISMALASLVLPFLPLLAGQILLNNLLSDVPAVGIADDAVDPEMLERPPRWDMRFLRRFMIEFGLLSSVFDLLTFAVLLVGVGAGVELFRTGWFVESLLTELAVALVVRTRRPFYRSRPGRLLLWSTAAVAVLAFAVPFLPFADLAGFVPMPIALVAVVAGITLLYVAAVEGLKRWFYRGGRPKTRRAGRFGRQPAHRVA